MHSILFVKVMKHKRKSKTQKSDFILQENWKWKRLRFNKMPYQNNENSWQEHFHFEGRTKNMRDSQEFDLLTMISIWESTSCFLQRKIIYYSLFTLIKNTPKANHTQSEPHMRGNPISRNLKKKLQTRIQKSLVNIYMYIY